MLRFLSLILLFFGINFLCRYPFILSFGFLNEDTALILHATEALHQKGIFYYFYHPYGPKVIRPWQLLGLSAQEFFFHGWPLGFHLVSLAVFSVGQTLMVLALRPLTGSLAAFFAMLMIGLCQIASEPLYWISDQHDLILFFFCALILLFARKLLTEKAGLLSGFFLFLSYWGAFFSNEKSVILPVIVSLYALFWPLFSKAHSWRERVVTLTASMVAFVSYFIFRYQVLGVLIGGYRDGLLPDAFDFRFLLKVLLSVLFTPLRQYSESSSLVGGWSGIGVLLILLVLLWRELSDQKQKQRFLIATSLGFVALMLAALPTLRYIHPPSSFYIFSTRMHWLILIMYGVQLSFLFRCVFERQKLRLILLSCVVIYLGIAAYSFRVSPQRIKRASILTQDAYRIFRKRCSCSSDKKPQTEGLPVHFDTVNVFTEPAWIEEYAHYYGMPRCTDTNCKIRYHFAGQKLRGRNIDK